jgi:hypothetical protein
LKRLGFPVGIRPDKSIAQFQPEMFQPEMECVPEMELVVCLIADSLPRDNQPGAFESSTSYHLCYTMMSAMKLLQTIFRQHEHANAYLQDLKLERDERASIDFVLSSEKRQIILKKRGNEAMDKEELKHAWIWFQTQTQSPKSVCGLVFRVAEMGTLKKITNEKLLDELNIGSLSRSSTSEIEA